MSEWLIAMILRPFAALIVFGFICLPVRFLIQIYMPEGGIKRFLLLPLDNCRRG